MKKHLVLMTLVVTIFSMGMIGGFPTATTAKEEKWVVGYSAAALIDAWQVQSSEALKETLEKAGAKCITIDSAGDIIKQISDIEDLLIQNIDLLIVNPNDEHGIVPAVEATNKAGVPVMAYNRSIAGGEVVTLVTYSEYRAGFCAGEYIAMLNGFRGHVMDLTGPAGQSVARERSRGFIDAIAQYPDMKVVSQPGDWERPKAMAVTEDAFTADPNIVGIWAHCDDMIMGAAEVLKEIGKVDQVITVGMGMYGGAPEAIKEGSVNASWELFFRGFGETAGEAALKILRGEKVPEVVYTPMVFVTKDNIDRFLKK